MLSKEHPDGWGIALGQRGQGWTLHRSLLRADDDLEFHHLASQGLGDIIVAHVRQKTRGDVAIENTHPFESAPWVFTHNGTVNNVEFLDAHTSSERRARIQGDTDSERLFAFLMSRIDQVMAEPWVTRVRIDQTLREATRELDLLPQFGTASFLLSDGNVLYAHRLGAPLYLLQRTVSDESGCPECAGNPSVAVTTEPITDEDWILLDDGDLIRIARDSGPTWERL